MKKYFSLISLALVLSGCGIAPYRKEINFMFVGFGGYYDTPDGADKYFVQYETGHTAFQDREKVYDFALLRATDLTLTKGFKNFEIYNERRGSAFACLFIQLLNTDSEKSMDAQSTRLRIRQKYGMGKPFPAKGSVP